MVRPGYRYCRSLRLVSGSCACPTTKELTVCFPRILKPGDDLPMRLPINPPYTLREATAADIPVLARHHRRMFEEIQNAEPEPVDPARMAAVERAYSEKLDRELKAGTCTAWVVVREGIIAASGGMSRLQNVPVPEDPGCTVALLHSIYSEPGHRRRGCAGMIVRAVLLHCQREGICRVQLVASKAGLPLYAANGFSLIPNMMRRLLA